jgi:hypothetical protein
LLAAILLFVAIGCASRTEQAGLGSPEHVAPGVEWYRTTDASLVENVGPISVSLLRLDPSRVRIAGALSSDEVLGADTVASIAAPLNAIAAVNGGFFNRENGEPTGLLKVAGELVSDVSAIKGAVLIANPVGGPTELSFDQLAARVAMSFMIEGQQRTVRIDGVDTTRARGRLMLYTPRYHADTDTAPTGTEWVLDGEPLRVIAVRAGAGRTPIPRKGAVLSFGGTTVPDRLAGLVVGAEVRFETRWRSRHGLAPDFLERFEDIVNGAGLLRREGTVLTDWRAEGLNPLTFTNVRHPRTMIGRDAKGFIWLAAVDGRQPDHSIGMTFADLERLCARLELRDALNLDGGGSTTMVVRGRTVNRPSDPGGDRSVSDAIVVMAR